MKCKAHNRVDCLVCMAESTRAAVHHGRADHIDLPTHLIEYPDRIGHSRTMILGDLYTHGESFSAFGYDGFPDHPCFPSDTQYPRTCNICKVEAVRAGIAVLLNSPHPYAAGEWPPETVRRSRRRYDPRAVAIVALGRIVDRAVSVELDSTAQVDEILRIALRALNQLED
jgi:hypothetical protein